MGNCCQTVNPCDSTVDETKGLLTSSNSKDSTKAEGTEGVLCRSTEVAEESKNEEQPTELDREVVTSQPNAVDQSMKPQSSYSKMMSMLQTEKSHAAQASQSSPPEVSKEQEEATVETTETKNNIDAVLIETTTEDTSAPPGSGGAEAQDVLKKVDNADVNAQIGRDGRPETEEAPSEGSKKDVEKESTKIEKKESAEKVNLKKEATEMDKKEYNEVDMQTKPADVDKKDDTREDMETKPTDVDTEDAIQSDTEKEFAEVAKNNATQVDTNKKIPEVKLEKKPSEPDIEDKPKPSGEVMTEKDTAPAQEQALNDPTAEKPEVEQLAPIDVAQNDNKSDALVNESDRPELQTSSPELSNELGIAEKPPLAKSMTEEPAGEAADKDKVEDEAGTPAMDEVKKDLHSETQEASEEGTSPAAEMSKEVSPNSVENGQADDLKDEESRNVETSPAPAMAAQKTCEKPSRTESEAELSETSANVNSSVEVVNPDVEDATADQETTAEPKEKEQESTESLMNGLHSSPPAEQPEFVEAHGDTVQVEKVENIEHTELSPAVLLDEQKQETQEEKELETEKEKELGEAISVSPNVLEKEEAKSCDVQTGEIILSSSHAVEVALIPVSESSAEKEEQEEYEDLYRGAEDIEKELSKEKQSKPLLEFTIPGVEERCSLAAAVDILAYSEREWKGNTAKSTLIRKGYSEMSCSFSGLRRVRGDNYCALRATLYQVLATTTQTPAWLLQEDFTSLPEKLEAQEHLIGGWRFPMECRKIGEKEDAVEQLKHYLELLQKRWQAAAELENLEEKQRLCERVFQGGEEEYGLLEVLKFLMLARAAELHGKMQAGQEVPVFCWLLFARDTSENPRTLLSNHLSQVGFSGGLEQVEMFLLGYALQHTIQTFRLYMTDTVEFVTHYPDDHKQDWPCVCIVTEDDRHYNVPIRKPAQHQLNHDLSALWPHHS